MTKQIPLYVMVSTFVDVIADCTVMGCTLLLKRVRAISTHVDAIGRVLVVASEQ